MKPAEICNLVLKEKLAAVLGELTTPQIKQVLKEGDVHVKLPSGYVSQQKRRDLWSTKIQASIAAGNHEASAEVLQQFLLNHRRALLMEFLERLEVKHRQGETDESFLVTRPAEKIKDAAAWLLERHDPVETAAYLAYIAFQQRSTVFDGWQGLIPVEHAPEGEAAAAPASEAAAPGETAPAVPATTSEAAAAPASEAAAPGETAPAVPATTSEAAAAPAREAAAAPASVAAPAGGPAKTPSPAR